jgi:hypothetical protein
VRVAGFSQKKEKEKEKEKNVWLHATPRTDDGTATNSPFISHSHADRSIF